MEKNKIKCSFKDHTEIEAVIFCHLRKDFHAVYSALICHHFKMKVCIRKHRAIIPFF